MARAYFPLYFDQYISLVTNLNDEEAGRLFRAMLFYAKEGIELGLGARESVVWPLIQRDIENSKLAYLRRCAVNAANGRKGGRKSEGEANESDRFISDADERQAEEVKKAEQAKQAEQTEDKKTKQSSLQAREQKQGKQTAEADQTVQAGQAVEGKEAGPVDVGEIPYSEMSLAEKKKYVLAHLMDEHIREQREKLGITLPPHLRD